MVNAMIYQSSGFYSNNSIYGMSRDSSAAVATGYGLDYGGSIAGGGKRFLSSP
jgi:hypothetical protein